MSNTLKLGNGKWATGKDTLLSFSDTNNNYKPLPFSFSRDSSGTVINKDGLIETVGSGEPRIDFKDNTKGALKLEPQRSNLFTYSEAISNSSPKSGTFVDNFAISPDGTQNATKLTAINTDPYFYQSVTVGSGDYTISVYVKGIGSTIGKEFLLILGSGINSTPQTITGEWKRFTFSGTLSAGTTIRGLEIPNPAVSGDELLVWGLQLEQGSYATSYIPTSGQANGVTRVADSSSQTVPDSVIGQTEGTLFFELNNVQDKDVPEISIDDNSNNNRIVVYREAINGYWGIFTASNGSGSFTNSITIGDSGKFAISYSAFNFSLYRNGVEIVTHSGSLPVSLSKIRLNGRATSDQYGSKKYSNIKLHNTRLSNSELAALTS